MPPDKARTADTAVTIARQKAGHSSSERSRLYYDSGHQPRYERSYLWDSGAKNEVDEKSRTDREKKIRSLILR
jgi:hypothetical protein